MKHRQLCHVSIDKQRNARFLLILALIRFGKSSESAEVGKATDFPTESEAVKIRSAEHNDDAQRRDKEKLVEARTRIRKSKKKKYRGARVSGASGESGGNALERYTFPTKCLRGVCVRNILIRQLIEQSASAVGGNVLDSVRWGAAGFPGGACEKRVKKSKWRKFVY